MALPLLRVIRPASALSVGVSLGAAQLGLGRPDEARAAWQAALDLRERLLSAGTSAATRGKAARAAPDLVGHLVQLEVELDGPAAAVATLERGRALGLRAALGLDDLWLEGLSDTLRAPIVRARGQLDALRATPPTDTDGARPERVRAWEGAIAAAETELASALAAREAVDFTPPPALDAGALSGLVPEGGAVVLLAATEGDGMAFLLPHKGAGPVPVQLPGVGRTVLRELLVRWFRAYTTIPHKAATLDELWAALQAPNAVLVGVLDELWMRVMGPVLDQLAGVGVAAGGELVLMPQGDLALLPLHAAGHRVGDDVPWCVLDRHVVSYAPSGYALHTARERLRRRQADGQIDGQGCGDDLFGVFNPMQDSKDELPLAEKEEMPALAGLFTRLGRQARCCVGRDATVDRVLDGAEGASMAGYAHFACHGGFSEADPEASGLQLAHDARLTVARIVRELRLRANRWVALSACESGMVDVQHLPDEFVGLPAAFLQAGAPGGVAATLWSVYDQPTAQLMGRLYERHLTGGVAPAAALREAVLWLRGQAAELRPHRPSAGMGIGSRIIDDAFGDGEPETPSTPSTHTALTRMPLIWAPYTYQGA